MSIRDTWENFEREMGEKAKVVLSEEFKKLFELYPDAISFGFGAWTDGFNDGDTCYFRYREWKTSINGVDTGEIYQYSDGTVNCDLEKDDEFWLENKNWVIPFYQSAWNIIYDIPEEFFKSIFGDDRIVTINRDGTINLEITDHD